MRRLFLGPLVILASFGVCIAQIERFDIAEFEPPRGWKKVSIPGAVTYLTTTPDGNCQIVLYQSIATKGDVKRDFEAAWANIVTAGMRSEAQPVISSEKRPDGWEMYSGAANVTFQGVGLATVVTTASGLGRAISVQVTVAGSGSSCMPAAAAFIRSLKFEPVGQRGGVAPAAAAAQGSFEYGYIPPAGWTARRIEGHVRLESPGGSCLILIFPPQGSTGDLQKDAAAIFDQMYLGWQPQKTGEQRYTLSTGVLPGGQEFFMTEAAMQKLSADGTRYDGFETGVALVVKAGTQIAIVAARHNTSLMAHDDCYKKYATWRRFFNSFVVKNTPATARQEDPARRIIGRWSMLESGASGEYVFAANGNYAMIGVLGTTRTTHDIDYDRLYITTYAFPGDGSYQIAGDRLTLRRRGGAAEQRTVRFDRVNHGGTGWIDRIHMLRADAQGENEVTYEKQGK